MTKWGARCRATCWSARWRSWRPSEICEARSCGVSEAAAARSSRATASSQRPCRTSGARRSASCGPGRGERPLAPRPAAVSRETPAGSAARSAGARAARAARAAHGASGPNRMGGVVTLDQARAQQREMGGACRRGPPPPISLCIGPGGRSTMIEPGAARPRFSRDCAQGDSGERVRECKVCKAWKCISDPTSRILHALLRAMSATPIPAVTTGPGSTWTRCSPEAKLEEREFGDCEEKRQALELQPKSFGWRRRSPWCSRSTSAPKSLPSMPRRSLGAWTVKRIALCRRSTPRAKPPCAPTPASPCGERVV